MINCIRSFIPAERSRGVQGKVRGKDGFSVIEIIIGCAILLGVFLSMGGIAQYVLRLSYDANLRIRSSLLATEGIEAVKIMRDRSWSSNIASLTPGTTYSLVFSTDRWTTTTATSTIDGIFIRTFTIQNVLRNASDDIAESGTNDPDTKLVTVTVAWSDRGIQRQDSIATYITNLFSN